MFLCVIHRINLAVLIILLSLVALAFHNEASYGQIPEFEWAERAGGVDSDFGFAITTDGAGDLIVAGRFQNTADFAGTTVTAVGAFPGGTLDHFIAKYDTDGNLIWIKHTGGDVIPNVTGGANWAFGVATDGSDNVIATGGYPNSITFETTTLPNGGPDTERFIVKYSPSGSLLWAKAITGTHQTGERGGSVTTDNMDNVLVTGSFAHHNFGGNVTFDGTTFNTFGGRDIFIVKYDPNGTFLWARQAGGTATVSADQDNGLGIATDSFGNSIITGRYKSTATFGSTTLANAGRSDIFVAKYDPNGNLLWVTRAGGSGPDTGRDVAIDVSDNIIITGSFEGTADFQGTTLTSAGRSDIFIAKYNSSGSLIWVTQAGGTGSDIGGGIDVNSSGHSFATGLFEDTATFGSTSLMSAGGSDIFVAEYDANGNALWARRAGSGNTDQDFGRGIALDDVGNSFITGNYTGIADFGSNTITSSGSVEIFIAKLGLLNQPPVADAGDDQTVECADPAGTPITLDGTGSSDPDDDSLIFTWTGPFPEGGGTINGSTPMVTLPLGMHIITLTVDDGNGGTDTDEVIITVEDTTPPEITAALVPIIGGGDDDDDDGFAAKGASTNDDDDDDGGGFIVECIASDTCDPDPTITSIIVTPTLHNPTERFRTRNRKKLIFDLDRNRIIVQGPDPPAFWAQVQADEGVAVVSGQVLALSTGDGDDDDDDGGGGRIIYRFDNAGDLTSVEGGIAVLRCRAMDDSGNIATAEATPPAPGDDDDDDDGDDDDSMIPRERNEDAETIRGAAVNALPENYSLYSNYPNPFNPQTTIRFGVPEASKVRLVVYDVLGREVRVLIEGQMPAGAHQAVFEAVDLPSGIYLVRLETPAGSFVKTMHLLK